MGTGQCQAGDRVSARQGSEQHSPGHRPCPSRQAPLALPLGHPRPAAETGTGHRTRRDHPVPLCGVFPAVPPYGAVLRGAAPLAAAHSRPQTLSPLGPRSPSAPGSPCVGEKTEPTSLHGPSAVPSHSPLGCPLPSAHPRTFPPLGPTGPRSPGKPMRLPSTTSACEGGHSQGQHPGTPARSPLGTALPRSPCQGTVHPRSCSSSPGDGPQQHPSLTFGPGGPWGPGKPSLPWRGEKNRLSIKGTAGHRGAEPPRCDHC